MKRLLSIILAVCCICMCMCTVSAEEVQYPFYKKSATTYAMVSKQDQYTMIQYALNNYVTHLRFKYNKDTTNFRGMTTPYTEGCDAFTNDLFYTIATTYGGYWHASLETTTWSDGTKEQTYLYSNDNGINLRYSAETPDDIYITYSGMSLFPYAYKTGKHEETIEKDYVDLYRICRKVVDDACRGAENDDVLFEKRIHDWVCQQLDYDFTLNVFTAEGALRKGKGVCQAYAELFQLLLKMGGVDCWYIWGTATNTVGNLEKHAWNCVKLNNKYYYVDVTWDDVTSDSLNSFKERYSDYAPYSIIQEKDERGYNVNYIKGYRGNSWARMPYDIVYIYFNRGYTTMAKDHYMWTDTYKNFYNY